MDDLIRRNHYDVTDQVFIADPRAVCTEVSRLLAELYPTASLYPIRAAFDTFSRLYSGDLPGYLGCETWYHDAQHSLDCTLVLARLIHGHEQDVPSSERFGERRAALGVITALFHDAGYIRGVDDDARHGAEYTLHHVRRSGDFLAAFLPTIGFADEGDMTEQLVHFTGYEIALDRIRVEHPLDRRLGFMLGSADLLAQMSDRCYLEKCRDFLYPEFEICGMAGPKREGEPEPLYGSPEELMRRSPEFIDSMWRDRLDGYFEGTHRYAATYFGGVDPYVDALGEHRRRLDHALATDQIFPALRRRAEAVNAGPLRVLLGLQAPDPAIRAASRPPVEPLSVFADEARPGNRGSSTA